MVRNVHELQHLSEAKREARAVLAALHSLVENGVVDWVTTADFEEDCLTLGVEPVRFFFRTATGLDSAFVQYGHFVDSGRSVPELVVDGEWDVNSSGIFRHMISTERAWSILIEAFNTVLSGIETKHGSDVRLATAVIAPRDGGSPTDGD